MVLARRARDRAGGILLHNAKTGQTHALGGASKHLIHAHGRKVVYAEKADGSDTETVVHAEITLAEPPK